MSENNKDSIHQANITQEHVEDAKGDYDFLYNVKPVHLIFFASLPLCLGAFAGYRVEMNRVASASAENYSPGGTASGGGLLRKVMSEELKEKVKSADAKITPSKSAADAAKEAAEALEMKRVRLDVGRLAFKALGLGSMLSIGGVGLLTAGIFRMSGCESLQEMINTWQEWTPRKRKELENYFGIEPKSMQHEDVKATKGMTEDQEWEFIKRKYIPELVEEENKKE